MSTIHCFICITISNNIYRKVKSGHVNQASARTRKCFWPFIFQFCAMLAILVRTTLEFLTKMHYRCLKKEKKGNHINCATEHQLMPKPNCCYNISKPIKRFAIFSQLSEFIFFYHGKIWNSKKTFLCIFWSREISWGPDNLIQNIQNYSSSCDQDGRISYRSCFLFANSPMHFFSFKNSTSNVHLLTLTRGKK